MLLLESALCEKACLAGSFPHVLRRLAAESLVARGECLLAPALAIRVHELRRQCVAHAPLAQLMTDFQRALPTRHPLRDEALGESPVGEKVLGLERVQDLADQRLGKAALTEFAAELGARMLAARQQDDRLFANCLAVFVQASASSAASSSSASLTTGVRDNSLSRRAVSISLAISGCCLRNSRTLSRP